jgi:hypothetical protein
MRSGFGRRRAGAILGRVIPAFRCAAVAARSSVGALHQDEASSRRGKGRAGSATRPAFGGGRRGPVGLHTAAIVALRCGANLVLALVWLLVQSLHLPRHHDWVIGTYFSSFILADVTTTTLLGTDHIRARKALHDEVPLWRVLLVKNLALVVIVGLPTLAAATAMTLWLETPARLVVTIPNVAVPIVSWVGVGNLVSVLFPVGDEPLIHRWEQRRDRRATIRWIAHLVFAVRLVLRRRPHRRHRAQRVLAPGSAGHRSDIGPRESQFRPHRHRGGRLGYCDRYGGAVLLGAPAFRSRGPRNRLNGRAETSPETLSPTYCALTRIRR